MKRITASMLYWLKQEPFMVWCDLFAPEDEKTPYSPFKQLLMQKGRDFEAAYIAALGTAVKSEFKDLDAGFEQTKKFMKEGASIIAGMPLVDKQHSMNGIPDVLVKKTTHKSVFGKFHYVVHEVKSGKELKDEYVIQAAFYHLMVSRIQGYTPQYFYVITKNEDGSPETHRLDFEQVEYQLKRALQQLVAIMDEVIVPPPNVKGCDEPWLGFCMKKAKEMDDISLVANVGTDKQFFLRQAGITTIAQLAKRKEQVEGIADTKLDQLRACAIAFQEGQSSMLQPARIPSADTELFIDFEGADIDGTKREYLIGIIERTGAKQSFHAFVANTTKEEGKMFKDALAFLRKHKDAPIFHYAPYEKTAFKVLGERYRQDVKDIIQRMTDLLQVCRRCVAPSTSTFQLKDFGKALGGTWHEGMNGGQSLVLYEEHQKTKDKKVLQQIIDYNEDDVKATVIVKDWLVKNSSP